LEVIEFQEEAVERQLRDTFREAIEVVSPTERSMPLGDILLRALRSSPVAAEEAVRRVRNRIVHDAPEIAGSESEENDEAAIDELPSIPGGRDERLIEVLDRLLVGLESLVVDSKLDALVRRLAAWQIRGRWPGAICILSEYRSTLFYLQTELERLGLHSTLFHGSMSFDERSRAVHMSSERNGVLVATAAAVATGGNLAQFDVLLFYDLPSSPLRLREVVSRFKRLGRMTPLAVKVLHPQGSDFEQDSSLRRLRGLVFDEEQTGVAESH
jgi:superfamily II DNA/RNA helicase